MALVLKCGAIFLHIPKTGGSWVRQVLGDCDVIHYELGDKHADMDQVRYYAKFRSGKQFLQYLVRKKVTGKVLRRAEENYYTFCFVRHPLDWYESYWKFNSERGWPRWGEERDVMKWHPNAELSGCENEDFNGFVRQVIRHHPGYVTNLYSRYTRSIDFVGKQENLVQDLSAVLTHLNVKFDEEKLRSRERVNVSRSSEDVQWDSDLRRQVERLEYASIVRYGYDRSMQTTSGWTFDENQSRRLSASSP